MDPLTWLRAIPAALGPFFAPLASIVLVIMGLTLAMAWNNPSLKQQVKEHLGTLIFAAALVFIGGSGLVWFLGRTGLPVQ
jgi:hypothetical protein